MTKTCPFCAEKIEAVAKKCRWCGEWLEEPDPDWTWTGDTVVVKANAQLNANQCLICGGGEGVHVWHKKFRYTPPWVYIGLLGGILPAAILSAIATKTETVSLSRCAACKSRLFWKIFSGWFFGLGGLFLFPIVGAIIGQTVSTDRDAASGGIGLGILAWIVALIVVAVMNAVGVVKCRLIENGLVTLKFPSPAITKSLMKS